jgi:hypothetical protein
LRATRKLGRAIRKQRSGYHRRSLAETKTGCFKRLGERLMARDFDRQAAELQVRAPIPDRFTRLGTPQTVCVAWLRLGSGEARPQMDLCDGAR